MPFLALMFPVVFAVLGIVVLVMFIRSVAGGNRRPGQGGGPHPGSPWHTPSTGSDSGWSSSQDPLDPLRYHQTHAHQQFDDERRDHHQSQDVPDSYGGSTELDSSSSTSCGGGGDFGGGSSDSGSSSDSGGSSSSD